MWRICRKTIFPRWHANRQNAVENKKKPSECLKSVTVFPNVNERGYSEENSKHKQHANKKEEKFWDDPQFQYYSLRKSLLETAGFVGTAVALCLNLHHKHCRTIYRRDRPQSCLFSKLAFAMPHSNGKSKCNVLPLKNDVLISSEQPSIHTAESHEQQSNSLSIESIVQSFSAKAAQYMAALENSTGYQKLDVDDKASFLCFQESAKLGSAQGFYNLGLCYEQGRGTKVDINKAAYCYRQATLKGHGLASYNLAIYFLKGLGGLPVDSETAGQLMLEAAEQDVPEAKLYLGVEYLEQEMWSDAFNIFSDLANKNDLEGKFHLGLCYENGWGVKKDEMLAVELFSQAAIQGHSEATLSLGKCFEEGRGSCDKDKEFALTLYRMLADSNSKAVRDAAAILKRKIESSSVTTPKISPKPQKSTMHVSASVPELTCDENATKSENIRLTLPEYLDLILPFIPLSNGKTKSHHKTSFYIEEEMLAIHPARIPVLPYHQNQGPQLMTAKT